MAAGQQPDGPNPYTKEPDGYATDREFVGYVTEREFPPTGDMSPASDFDPHATILEPGPASGGADRDPHQTYRETEADQVMVRLPAALRDRYTVLNELPDPGTEADVLLVQDNAIPGDAGRMVAKIYRRGMHADPAVWARVRELSSPSIVRFTETGTSGGRDYEVMEYVPGGNLAKLAALRAPMPLESVFRVVAQVSDALSELHGHGIIHRDLKPENVLVRTAEPVNVVVTDFGLAQAPEQSVMAASRTGTLAYLAPETLLSKGAQSSKARDWWALGMIVRDLLTGSRAFNDMTEAGIVQSLGLRPVDLGGITDARAHLLCRGLLLRDPAQRWGAAEVSEWLSGGTPAVADEPVTEAADITPITFQAVEYRDRNALALALGRSWDEAVTRYFKPSEHLMGEPSAWRSLQRWLEAVRESDDSDIEEFYALVDRQLVSGTVAPDVKLLLLIQWLNPELPPVYRGRAMDSDDLAALAERVVVDPEPEPGLSQIITELRRDDLLPRLARMPGGGALAEVNARWQALNGQFRELAGRIGPNLPPGPRQELMPEDNPRRQAALLFLALNPQAHAARLQEHRAGLPGLLPMPVRWFDGLREAIAGQPNSLNDALELTVFPAAARDSAALDLARRQQDEALERAKGFWANREQQRLANAPDAPRALGNACVAAGIVVVVMLVSLSGNNPPALIVASILVGLVTIGIAAATELNLAQQLGSDYSRFPRLDGRRLREMGQHIHGVGSGILALIVIAIVVGAAIKAPPLAFIVVVILQLRSWFRRRSDWKRVHEQEQRRILGSAS